MCAWNMTKKPVNNVLLCSCALMLLGRYIHFALYLSVALTLCLETPLSGECWSAPSWYTVLLPSMRLQRPQNDHDAAAAADSWLLSHERLYTPLVHPHRCFHLLCLNSPILRTVCVIDSSLTPLLVFWHLLGRYNPVTIFIGINFGNLIWF